MYPTERKRYIILGAAIGAVFLFFVVVMMLTQLRDGEDYARQAAQGISITQQTSAARGEIVDATGKAFTGNTTICNITIDSNYFTEQELNPLLLTLTALCRDYGCEWRDELPISTETPYTFTGEEAALRAVTGNEFHMDVGTLNDRYFNYIAAFGAFTETSYATPQEIKNALGHLAYILEGVKSLGKILPIHVKITADDEQFEEDYLFGAVTNTISLGGVLKLDPEKVLLDDGMYELLLVKNPTNALEAQAMLTAIMTQNFDGPLVKMFHASDITFESSHEISWTIDGEYGGTFSHTHILNNKNAVTLIV